MARSALAGSRIRERRTLAGIKQADLAREAGISASYLNLIEHNRRNVGAALLRRIAEALGVDPAALTEGVGAALLDGLREAATAAAPAERRTPDLPELERIEEFVGRFPGWAGLLAALQGRVAHLERTVETLSDRMAHDPYLSASLHEVLSAVTSVRSTAAILAETEDIEPEWRARFHRNLHDDSVRLAEGAESLVAYLDGTMTEETGLAAPQEELEAWLGARGYHVAELERASAPEPESLIAEAPELASTAARKLATAWLRRYLADAHALPLDRFRPAAEEMGYDPGRLAQQFGADLGAVFRRLASLPDVAGRGTIGLVACDGSGTLVFRKATEGFALPRFGSACPLWPLYQALSRPMTPIRALVEMGGRGRRRFLTYAICQPRHPGGFDGPQVLEAQMLVLPETAVPGGGDGPVLAVGTSCRICPRGGCAARREPSILAEEF
ncbi:helix-turn-helix domain-containing protein [Acidimangrovimonas pyrenivorans]|uniref:Helix-turn-helix domain-containing protein n=1 Tax=Acidimangrovimonas pyrenivorans TaxID=2030798 RepID=A0ABV7AIB3_9RHOB